MLEAGEKSKNQVAVESVEIEACVFNDGKTYASLVLPPVDKMIQGTVVNKKITQGQNVITHDYDDFIDKEINSLVKYSERYQNEPAFYAKMSGLLRARGRAVDAERYAKLAFEHSNQDFYKYRLAETQIDLGDVQAAKVILLELTEAKYVDAYLRLAEFSVREGSYLEAGKYIDDAVSIDPLDSRIRLFAGTLSLYVGDYQKSLRHYRVAKQSGKYSSTIYFNMAIAHFLLGNINKSLVEAKKSLAFNPWARHVIAFFTDISRNRKTDKDYSEALLKRYLRLYPGERAFVSRLSDIYYYEGEFSKGIELLEGYKKYHSNASLLNNLGVFWKEKKSKIAFQYFLKAVETAGGFVDAHLDLGASAAVVNLAAMMLDSGDHRRAKVLINDFISTLNNNDYLKDPIISRLVLLQTKASILSGDVEEAVQYAVSMIDSKDLYLDIRAELSAIITAYYSFVTGEYDEALKYAQIGCDLIQNISTLTSDKINTAKNNLAYVLIENGLLNKAGPIVSELKDNLRYSEYILATKGLYEARRGHVEKAIFLYQKAIGMSVDSSRTKAIRNKMNLELGKYWFNSGDHKKAIKFLTKVVREKPVIDLWEHKAPKEQAKKLLSMLHA